MAPRGGSRSGGNRSNRGRGGDSTQVSPTMVESFLKDVEYPCEKSDLLDLARDNDAPEEVINLIEQFEDRTYDSPTDVAKEIGKLE